MGAGGNIAVLPGRDGKLLIDAGFAGARPRITDALASIRFSLAFRKDWWLRATRPHYELFKFSLAGIEAVIVNRIGRDAEPLLSNTFQVWNRLRFVRDQRRPGARWRSRSAVGPAGYKLNVHIVSSHLGRLVLRIVAWRFMSLIR
jgi:hypothetical protein